MDKVQVEFINTCPCCDEHVATVLNHAKKYPDIVETHIYYAGKDTDYIRKYGMIIKGTLIINGKKKYDSFTRAKIEAIIDEAVGNR